MAKRRRREEQRARVPGVGDFIAYREPDARRIDTFALLILTAIVLGVLAMLAVVRVMP